MEPGLISAVSTQQLGQRGLAHLARAGHEDHFSMTKGPVLDGLAIPRATLHLTVLSLMYKTVTTKIKMEQERVGAHLV